MNKSETIGKLVTAMAIVQAKLKPAKFDSDNPFFKSKYASLGSVIEADRDLLSANGLAVFQPVSGDVNGVMVETVLAHVSGEWISAGLTIKPAKADAQGIGSAITYGRRYGRSAMVGGVSDVDDDGNHASQTDSKHEHKDVAPSEKKQYSKPPAGRLISEKQGKLIYAKSMSAGMEINDLKAMLLTQFGFASSRDITADKMDEILAEIAQYKPGVTSYNKQPVDEQPADDLPYDDEPSF